MLSKLFILLFICSSLSAQERKHPLVKAVKKEITKETLQKEITLKKLKELSLLERRELLDNERAAHFDKEVQELSISLGREGNGGDEEALSFASISEEIISQIEAQKALIYSNNKDFESFDLETFIEATKLTKIYFVDYKLCSKVGDYRCPKEKGFVAKNYPSILEIHVNQGRWEKLNNLERLNIVFHEYLGIIGVEKGRYNLSSSLITSASEDIKSERVHCSITLIDKSDFSIYTASITGNRYDIGSKLLPLKKEGSITKYVAPVVISSGYLRVQVKEGYESHGTTWFKEKGLELIKETVLFDGAVSGSKKIQNKDFALQASCMGL